MTCRLYTRLSRRWRSNYETKPLEESFRGPSPQQAPESLVDTPPPPYAPPLAGLREGLRENVTTHSQQSTKGRVSLDTRRDRHPDSPPPYADRPVKPLLHEPPLHKAAEATATQDAIEVNCTVDVGRFAPSTTHKVRGVLNGKGRRALSWRHHRRKGTGRPRGTNTKSHGSGNSRGNHSRALLGHGLGITASTSTTADPHPLWPANIHSMRAPEHQQPQQHPPLPRQLQQPDMVFTRAWAGVTGTIYVGGILMSWMVRADMAWAVGAGMFWMVGMGVLWLIEGVLNSEQQEWRLRYEQWRLSYEQWRLQYQQWHVQYQQQQQQ